MVKAYGTGVDFSAQKCGQIVSKKGICADTLCILHNIETCNLFILYNPQEKSASYRFVILHKDVDNSLCNMS